MIEALTRFGVTFAVFMGIDLIWLGAIAKNYYSDQMAAVKADSFVWPAAIAFYILFVIGLLYFVLYPALESGSVKDAVIRGALYGFFTYMTYELTAWAVLKDWPAQLVFVDILWGVVLAGSVSWLSYLVLSNISN